jgi:cyclic pyranopterin phosphate synthase
MSVGYYPLDQFANDINALAQCMRVSNFRLLGGEPLLNPDLIEYVSVLRTSGITEQISIATNGILLNRCNPEVFHRIDVIDVTVYPLKKSLMDRIHRNIDTVKANYPCLVHVHFKDRFLLQDLGSEIKDPSTVQKTYSECWIRRNCHAIYRGFYFKCIQAARKGTFLRAIGCTDDFSELDDWNRDGIDLHQTGLQQKLRQYLDRDTPFSACRWCLGTSSRSEAHTQLPAEHQNAQPPLKSPPMPSHDRSQAETSASLYPQNDFL